MNETPNNAKTPDGLIIHWAVGHGLMVREVDHNTSVNAKDERIAQLQRALEKAANDLGDSGLSQRGRIRAIGDIHVVLRAKPSTMYTDDAAKLYSQIKAILRAAPKS